MCGFSINATELIIFRLVQGSGAAMMVVNSVALITEVFPANERGKALGINAITFSIGGVAGPILGGLILTLADWRWIFFINVPIGLIGAIWGYTALRDLSIRKKGERFDGVGALSFSLGLTALLGFSGRDLVRWSVARRGYLESTIVTGRNEYEARDRLFSARPDLVERSMVAETAP